MGWDWKSQLSRLFGGRAAPAVEQTPAQIARQQITNGTHREYSPAELDEIIECMRQLKEIIQNNILTMSRLAAATPVGDDPAVQKICEGLKTLKGEAFDDAQTGLIELNVNANTLEQARNNIAKSYRGGRNDKHLPVYDAERLLVIGVARQAEAVYTVHMGLTRMLSSAEPFVIIPESDRVKQALAESAEVIGPLTIKLCGIVTDSVGRREALGIPKPR